MKSRTLLAFACAGILLTTACEAFPTSMQDDPEAIEPMADMAQELTITEPPTSELKERIVFQQGPIRPEIYTMGSNGYQPKRLTRNVQADREPSWSFDAKKIVYRCHVLTFCMSNPDGTGAEQVYTHTSPPATDIGDPKLSPDGRSIAFDAEIFSSGTESTVSDILIYNLDTKAVRNVTLSRNREDVDPTWHPNGGLMWVENGVLVYDSDVTDNILAPLTLTASDRRVSKPDVSPSGTRIAYVAKLAGDNQTDVYVFDTNLPAETPDQKVTFTPFDDFAPSWSPNERKIAIASKDQPSDQDLEIFVVDTQPPEGGTATRRRLTFNDTDETEPDWAAPQVTASVQQRLTLPEGNPPSGSTTGTTGFTFAVFLSAPAVQGETVTVRVASLAGSATTGNDYTAVDETITFTAGEMTKSVTVPVVADAVAEPNESFSVRIQEVTNALVGNAEGRAIISNDDTPPTPTPTPTPTATPTPTPVPGVPGGQIAYTSGVDGDYDVWIMAGDGAGKTNLTSDPASEGSPDLSHDGRTVAYQRMVGSPSGGTPPDFQIYQVPSAGGAASFLNGTADAFDVTPAWSPDGSSLAWVASTSSGDPDIFTASPPNGSPAVVLDTPELEGYSEWGRLANGTSAIAYHVQPDDPAGQWEVRLVELSSKTVRSFGEGRHPEISPDGTKLVFASNRAGGDYEIYAVALGSPATPAPLTTNSVDDFTPSWSPDGTKIAWTSHPGGGRPDVFTMNADGSGQQNLTDSPATDDFEPSWGVKPSPSLPRETAPEAILVMVPLMGFASALAARRKSA